MQIHLHAYTPAPTALRADAYIHVHAVITVIRDGTLCLESNKKEYAAACAHDHRTHMVCKCGLALKMSSGRTMMLLSDKYLHENLCVLGV